MQKNLFERAKKYRDANMHRGQLVRRVQAEDRGAGGFLWAHWDGTRETEDRIAAETKATIRCIPFDRAEGSGQVHGDGQAVGGAGGVCEGVLAAGSALS